MTKAVWTALFQNGVHPSRQITLSTFLLRKQIVILFKPNSNVRKREVESCQVCDLCNLLVLLQGHRHFPWVMLAPFLVTAILLFASNPRAYFLWCGCVWCNFLQFYRSLYRCDYISSGLPVKCFLPTWGKDSLTDSHTCWW